MKIGMLGSSHVGQSLGTGLVSLGHEVMMGSREPGRASIVDWKSKAGAKASAGTFAEAAAFGEWAVLATAWSGTENAVRLAGADHLAGKVLIDVTNPLGEAEDAPPGMAVGGRDSAAEIIQRWLPETKVVKAFNQVSSLHMVKPDFPCGPPDMFICGEDAGAKKLVAGILRDFGWGVVDLGGIKAARLLEPLAMVYIRNAIRTNHWDYAFKLLKK
jgi:predicted dinucleotide-binding enzyme